jgi:hypothetical protein
MMDCNVCNEVAPNPHDAGKHIDAAVETVIEAIRESGDAGVSLSHQATAALFMAHLLTTKPATETTEETAKRAISAASIFHRIYQEQSL